MFPTVPTFRMRTWGFSDLTIAEINTNTTIRVDSKLIATLTGVTGLSEADMLTTVL